MTKMTIRLTTDKSKEYVDGIVRCMIGDYIHGHLTGLAVSVTGDQGNYHIRRGKKRTGCRPFPKELKIPEFMQKPRTETVDAVQDAKEHTGSIHIWAHENA